MSPGPPIVADIMSTEVSTLHRNDQLRVAEDLMAQARIRHLPVLDEDGVLCGVVSQRDLFRSALLRSLGYGSRAEDSVVATMLVKEAMSESLVTTTPKTTMAEAAAVMIDQGVGCLPVLDGDVLVGIVTEGDCARIVAGRV